jgi:hypothetical protein
MTPEIKALREKFEAARLDLLNLVKDSTPQEIEDQRPALAFIFGVLALSTIKDLLDALCKEP